MRSHQVLGLLALGAITVAAVSFGALDFQVGAANGCVQGIGACRAVTLPPCAVWLAGIGAVALLGSLVPGIQWLRTARTRTSDEDVRRR